ncbi:MAG: hypothetical protein WD492_06410 [Alkalispirochaeta sp.]
MMCYRLAALVAMAVTLPGIASAQISSERWAEVDNLHERDRHGDVRAALEELETDAARAADRAGILWRRARAEFSRIDLGLYAGEVSERDALERLAEIEAMADEAVRITGESTPAQAYFWRGAARAKQGELRGVLNALFMAGDLRDDLRLSVAADPEYSNPYYVAGQLYQRLPGFPVSFGDTEAAVSFARLAVDLHEAAYSAGEVPLRYWDYYVRLAENLNARSWSQRQRERRIPTMTENRNGTDTPFERAMYYEAVAEIPDQSDQAEAKELLNFVIRSLESQTKLTLREERTLDDARELAR